MAVEGCSAQRVMPPTLAPMYSMRPEHIRINKTTKETHLDIAFGSIAGGIVSLYSHIASDV